MQAFSFLMRSFSYSIVKILAFIPPSVFKGFSKLLAQVLFLIRYKANIIVRNLKRSFPKKSRAEIRQMKKRFYLNLTDVSTEIVYSSAFGPEKMKKYFRVFNPKLIDNLHEDHKNIVVIVGHLCNWEVGCSVLPLFVEQKVYAVYNPLSNPFSEGIISNVRNRFGLKLVKKEKSNHFFKSTELEKKTVLFLGDEKPKVENTIWANFLNQDTPVYCGAEKMAKKLNCPVVFMYNRRIKRGKYEIGFDLITENPSALNEGDITKMYVQKLEEEIKEMPSTWHWSYRWWGLKRPTKVPVN